MAGAPHETHCPLSTAPIHATRHAPWVRSVGCETRYTPLHEPPTVACRYSPLQAFGGEAPTETLAASLDPRGAAERQLLTRLLYLTA